MKEVNEGRRSALKKLGLGTGAVYVAPAVTALVVPQHATATSSSGSSSTSLVIVSQPISGFIDIQFDSSLNYSSSNTVTITVNGTVVNTTYSQQYSNGDVNFVNSSGSAPTLVSGTTYVVTVDSTTTYNVTF